MHHAGIDIGGTRIKAAAFSATGELLAEATAPGEAQAGSAWPEQVRHALAELEEKAGCPADTLGIAAPGLAAPHERWIHSMPGRLAGLEGLDWTEFLHRTRPVPVLNDAHAALLGEAWLGAARGARHAVMFTLGTGVGGAILSDGRLLRGRMGRAGHLGHCSLDPWGHPGIVGTPGTTEECLGECSLPRRTGGLYRDMQSLLTAADAGEPVAAAEWPRYLRALAAAIASSINALDPEVIILAGGITGLGDRLLAPLEKELRPMEWHVSGQPLTRLKLAELGTMAGACGAARAGAGLA